MRSLVAGGLRAQLKSGNLLTGDLLVDLDFHPESPPAKLDESGTYPVIPSVPTQLEVLTASLTGVMSKLSALPLPELVGDLRTTLKDLDGLVASPDTKETVAGLRESAARLQTLLATLDQRLGPLLNHADSTLASANTLVGRNSQLSYDLGEMMRELTGAARSIRVFADYLERHPEALLRGKAGAAR
jgi:paraquat-inducible protein B